MQGLGLLGSGSRSRDQGKDQDINIHINIIVRIDDMVQGFFKVLYCYDGTRARVWAQYLRSTSKLAIFKSHFFLLSMKESSSFLKFIPLSM